MPGSSTFVATGTVMYAIVLTNSIALLYACVQS
ncbi:hypothetical protein NIES4073_33310 [Kalymmatonema gypsitolerans NIES-4073]|nr:hypothetical protein NIES4073_33310 [Scytonema sp. NIES-4073]